MLPVAEALSICIRFSPVLVEKRGQKATEQMELSGNAPKIPGPAGSPGLSPKQNDSDDSGRKRSSGTWDRRWPGEGPARTCSFWPEEMGGSLISSLLQPVYSQGAEQSLQIICRGFLSPFNFFSFLQITYIFSMFPKYNKISPLVSLYLRYKYL